jgi:hypothetical protein
MSSPFRKPGLDRVPQFLVGDSPMLARLHRLPVNDFAPIEEVAEETIDG